MMKIVCDTNIWISSIFWRGNPYNIIRLAESGEIKIYITEGILKEIVKALTNEKKLVARIEMLNLNLHDLLKIINHISQYIETNEKIYEIKEDPNDNIILEAACAANVNYIVSGDNHLLNLKRFRGINIVSPAVFLNKIKQ